MAGEYDFSSIDYELPSSYNLSDTSGSGYSNDYTLSDQSSSQSPYSQGSDLLAQGQAPSDFNSYDSSWYVDSSGNGVNSDGTKVDTAMFDDIWGWVKSDQGTAVLGGAANAAFKLWQMEQAAKLKEDSQNHDSLEIAKMREERINRHNDSINTPMDINMVKLQRP